MGRGPIHITDEQLHAAIPDLSGTQRLPGLGTAVDLFRDQWGIPHIKARTERDLFFAQGFATAQDRLWQMDLDRQQALGRWSEFAGPTGLSRDRLLRAAGMGCAAKLDYEAASKPAKAMVDAYAAGVNAFMKNCQELPIEYTILGVRPELWQSWHCPAVYKVRNTLMGTFEAKLLRTRLAGAIGPQKLAALTKGSATRHLLTVPPGADSAGPVADSLEPLARAAEAASRLGEADTGSNAWVICGHLTRSGLPLVAGDSHRPLDTPNVYYQIHLSCPDFSVIGYAVPGMPGALHFCHNEYVAWGMTYGAVDTQDLFIERFRDGSGGRQYQFKNEWRPAAVRRETIMVRGGDPVEIEVTMTHHGPVVAGDPASGSAVTVSDPGLLEATPWLDAARDAMRSKSVNELHEALRNWTDRVNNYAVADVHGNFGYLLAGRVPIRTEANGLCAVPGWTGEQEWSGYIPYEELPKAINPQAGYVVSCNQRVTGPDYPYYLGLYWISEYRARRVQTQILELKPHAATVDDMARIHAERISIPARIFTAALLGAPPLDAGSAEAQSLLRQWDGAMDRDLVQPSIYACARVHATRWLVEHRLGDRAEWIRSGTAGGEFHLRLIGLEMILAIERGDCSMLGPEQDWVDVLAAALKRAVDDLKQRLGHDSSRWQWARLHRACPHHPLSALFPELGERLDPAAVPIHGDGDTPLAGPYALDDPFIAGGVSVNRYIHDPADWPKSRWIVPLGSSGHPASPHYADQAQLWSNVQCVPQLWDWDQIAGEAESHQRLEPVQ